MTAQRSSNRRRANIEPSDTSPNLADEPSAGGETPPMWWGTTTSALRVEGVAPAADWSRWELDGRAPRSLDGNGFATNHGTDFAQLAALGLTHVGLTLEWARLEPDPGKIDGSAWDLYDDVLSSANRAGLEVVATLVNGTLPGWFAEDEKGFPDERARELRWLAHVDRCAERYDGAVAAWVPIDDPVGWAVRSHLLGSRPPGVRDPRRAAEAAETALLANHAAWRLLSSGSTPTIGVFGAPTLFPVGANSSQLEAATERVTWWTSFLKGSWLGAVRDGELVLPDWAPRQVPEMAGTFDLIGLTHDHPIGVDQRGSLVPYPRDGRRSDSGFVPVPNEFEAAIRDIAGHLDNRDMIVAGHGVTTADDGWRAELLSAAIDSIGRCRRDGLAIRGYFHDTGIDGYEGPFGFEMQRGLLERNRNPKSSALLLTDRIARRDT